MVDYKSKFYKYKYKYLILKNLYEGGDPGLFTLYFNNKIYPQLINNLNKPIKLKIRYKFENIEIFHNILNKLINIYNIHLYPNLNYNNKGSLENYKIIKTSTLNTTKSFFKNEYSFIIYTEIESEIKIDKDSIKNYLIVFY